MLNKRINVSGILIFIISGWAFSYPIDKEQKYILYQLLCTWIGGTKCTIVSIHLETVLLMPNFTKFPFWWEQNLNSFWNVKSITQKQYYCTTTWSVPKCFSSKIFVLRVKIYRKSLNLGKLLADCLACLINTFLRLVFSENSVRIRIKLVFCYKT